MRILSSPSCRRSIEVYQLAREEEELLRVLRSCCGSVVQHRQASYAELHRARQKQDVLEAGCQREKKSPVGSPRCDGVVHAGSLETAEARWLKSRELRQGWEHRGEAAAELVVPVPESDEIKVCCREQVQQPVSCDHRERAGSARERKQLTTRPS